MKHLVNTTLLLLALLLPATALAYDFEVDGIYYSIINNTEATVSCVGLNDQYFYDKFYDPNHPDSPVQTVYYYVDIPSAFTINETTYTVTRIESWAFGGNTSVLTIDIPNTVTTIGVGAFWGTTWYEWQSGLVYAGLVAYNYNGTMPENTHLTLNEGTIGIADCAFEGQSSLTGITIPNSLSNIGVAAFEGCSSLRNIIVANGNPKYDSRDYCNAIIETASNTLIKGCNNTVIPNSIIAIGQDAFSGSSSLTSIIIPESVTNIGNNAFSGCLALNDVYCDITDPSAITMGSGVFYRNPENYAGRTLHVPTGTVAAYQADTRWSDYFGSIVEPKPDPVPAETIMLNVTTAGLNEGASLQLTATVLPENSDKNVLWSSNNPSVATVDSNGLVTTHSVGTTTITAVTTDGSNLNASCTVTLLPVGVKGDMNGDGRVTITDVTTLIDYLLSGETW